MRKKSSPPNFFFEKNSPPPFLFLPKTALPKVMKTTQWICCMYHTPIINTLKSLDPKLITYFLIFKNGSFEKFNFVVKKVFTPLIFFFEKSHRPTNSFRKKSAPHFTFFFAPCRWSRYPIIFDLSQNMPFLGTLRALIPEYYRYMPTP